MSHPDPTLEAPFASVDEGVAQARDKMKETASGFAMLLFVIFGLYLHIANRGFGSLFSLKAISFFVAGLFISSLVLGAFAYYVQRLVAKAMTGVVVRISDNPMGAGVTAVGGVIAVALLAFNVVVTYLATRSAFNWLYGLG